MFIFFKYIFIKTDSIDINHDTIPTKQIPLTAGKNSAL